MNSSSRRSFFGPISKDFNSEKGVNEELEIVEEEEEDFDAIVVTAIAIYVVCSKGLKLM